jgi:carbonic anhydrase/acetyltransferase-like protein (isoleucine patch superfamily)
MGSQSWITPYGNKVPSINTDAFVDVSARIIGDVHVDQGASIWPMVVLRADSAEIRIGKKTAILDLALIEAPEGYPVEVEDEALISHGAIIHGARIQSRALVGIGAIILEGALISKGSIIGSGTVVTPGTQIPSNSFVLGIPGKVVRNTTLHERQNMFDQLQQIHTKSRHFVSFNSR